jgi:hypothetical protein
MFFGLFLVHYIPGSGISSRTSILLPSIMKCGWSESKVLAASISSAWRIEYPPMYVFGLELPAFVTFISFPVGVPCSTIACFCASNHLTHGSIPFCMSSGLAFYICSSAETGDIYNTKKFFIVRAPPLIIFLFLVPANSNNYTNDHTYASCNISFASSPFALGTNGTYLSRPNTL